MGKTYSSLEAAALYAAIGMSLTIWASVESVLCNIFCGSINPEQSNPADRAFWAVISLDGKIDITGEVVHDTMNHSAEIMSAWKSIENKLRRSAKLRNKIAHGSAVWTHHPKTRKRELYLAPYFYSAAITHVPTHAELATGKFDPRPLNRLSTEAVEEIASGFVKLRNRLYVFREKQREYLERQEGLARQVQARRAARAGSQRGSRT